MASTTASARTESSFATGVLFVHSCPKALVPHVEWALAREIGRVVKLDWSPQPLLPHTMRTVADWRGLAGTAAAVASSLFGWQQLRFELTEDQSAAGSGGRWMHTPALGGAWDRELEPFRAAEVGDATIFELPQRLSAG